MRAGRTPSIRCLSFLDTPSTGVMSPTLNQVNEERQKVESIIVAEKRVKRGRRGNEEDILRFGHVVTEQTGQIAREGEDVQQRSDPLHENHLTRVEGKANSHDAHHYTLSDVERPFVRLGRHAERQDGHSVPVRVFTRQLQGPRKGES